MCTIEQAENFFQAIPFDVVSYSFKKILVACTDEELRQLASNCVNIDPTSNLEEYLYLLKMIIVDSDINFARQASEQKSYNYDINIFLQILELQQQHTFFLIICSIAEYRHKLALAARKITISHPELCVEPRGRKRMRNLVP